MKKWKLDPDVRSAVISVGVALIMVATIFGILVGAVELIRTMLGFA